MAIYEVLILLAALLSLVYLIAAILSSWRSGREHEPEEERVPIEVARERARQLLKRIVTPEEWREFEARQRITVRTAERTYELHLGTATSMREASGETYSLCVIFRRQIYPPEDKMLAEYLMIRHDERRYLRIANKVMLLRSS